MSKRDVLKIHLVTDPRRIPICNPVFPNGNYDYTEEKENVTCGRCKVVMGRCHLKGVPLPLMPFAVPHIPKERVIKEKPISALHKKHKELKERVEFLTEQENRLRLEIVKARKEISKKDEHILRLEKKLHAIKIREERKV